MLDRRLQTARRLQMIRRRRRACAKPSHKPFLDPVGCRNEGKLSRALAKPERGPHVRQFAIDLHVVHSDAFYGESPFECLPGFDAIKRADAPHCPDGFGNIADQKTCDAVVDDLRG